MKFEEMKIEYSKWLRYEGNMECIENMLSNNNLNMLSKILDPKNPRELQFGASLINLQNDLYKVIIGENLKEVDLSNSTGVNYIVKRLNGENVEFNELITYELVHSYLHQTNELYEEIADKANLNINERIDNIKIETQIGLFFRRLNDFVTRNRNYEQYPELINFSNNFYKIYNENMEIKEKAK